MNNADYAVIYLCFKLKCSSFLKFLGTGQEEVTEWENNSFTYLLFMATVILILYNLKIEYLI